MVSPGSILPPGPFQRPTPNPRFFIASNTCPSRTTRQSVRSPSAGPSAARQSARLITISTETHHLSPLYPQVIHILVKSFLPGGREDGERDAVGVREEGVARSPRLVGGRRGEAHA